MNNEQQTWTLKQPIEAEYRPIDEDCDYERMFVEVFGEAISLDKFNNLFQPLDVSGLTRQVEESLTFLCQYAYDAGYTIGDDRTVTGKDVDLSVKATALEIVGLLLNQERESK